MVETTQGREKKKEDLLVISRNRYNSKLLKVTKAEYILHDQSRRCTKRVCCDKNEKKLMKIRCYWMSISQNNNKTKWLQDPPTWLYVQSYGFSLVTLFIRLIVRTPTMCFTHDGKISFYSVFVMLFTL